MMGINQINRSPIGIYDDVIANEITLYPQSMEYTLDPRT